MKNLKKYIPSAVSYFFILLFCYAAISKMMDFENFQVQIGQSPLLSAYAGFISYAVIVMELFIVAMLIFEPTRRTGLYGSTALMSAFSIYIFLILNYSDFVPCSCGGILEKMGWTEHLIFNLITVVFGITAILQRIQPDDFQFRRKVILKLLTINSMSVMTVIFLFLSSEYIIKKENNFTRRFLLYPIVENKNLTLENKNYYFAGEDKKNIYLGSKEFPQILTAVSKDFSKRSILKIIPDNLNYSFKSLRIIVKDSYYYLSDGTVPIIYRGKINDSVAKTVSYQDAYFSQIAVQDSTHFIIRSIHSRNKQLIIGTLSLTEKPKIKFNSDIIIKQKDGIFDTDGHLTSTDFPYRVIYLYNYRNQFVVTDRNLNIQQNLKTIDTVSVAATESKRLSDGRYKMIVPPVKVNENISAKGNIAFIHSVLRGRNESRASWNAAKVIDIYRLDKKEYIGSFYIYHEGERKMTDYLATDEFFYVLLGNKLVRYSYQKTLTKNLKTG